MGIDPNALGNQQYDEPFDDVVSCVADAGTNLPQDGCFYCFGNGQLVGWRSALGAC
jgi:hypothetical protein